SYASSIHANSLEMAMAIKIKINGVDRTVDVDGDTPLLWVLRVATGSRSALAFGSELDVGDEITRAFRFAARDSSVRTILFRIDRAGGWAFPRVVLPGFDVDAVSGLASADEVSAREGAVSALGLPNTGTWFDPAVMDKPLAGHQHANRQRNHQ